MSMNYKTLKKLIVRNVEKTSKHTVDFEVDLDALNNDLAELELVCIPYGQKGRRISMGDIPLCSEYFREDKMGWISDEKFLTSLIFVDANKVDDDLEAMIEDLKKDPTEEPDIDMIRIVSYILGNYPCYLALVVSYQNNSPNSSGKNSYVIACRANKVIIKDPEYVYVPHHPATDNVEDQSDNTDGE